MSEKTRDKHMILTEAQVKTITDNIEKFTFTDSNNNKTKCKNIAVAPDNIWQNQTGLHLVITCDTYHTKAIACYVSFEPETMDVLGVIDEYQVDGMLVDKYVADMA